MTKKNTFLLVASIACALTIGVIGAISSNHVIDRLVSVGVDTPNLLLDSSQTPNTITASYQNNVNGSVRTTNGNAVELGFVNAKTASGAFVQLAPRGKIFNFQDGNEVGRQITGISSIKVTTSSGNVSIRVAPYRSSAGVILGKKIDLTSGVKTDLPYAKYFELTAADGGATITSIEMNCSCVGGYDVSYLEDTYTGTGADGYIYKMTVSNISGSSGSVTIQSLDKPSNTSSSGTISMTSATSATCTFSNKKYVFNVSNDYCDLSHSSHTIATIPVINFNRVYTVENFQSYTETGQGYTNSTTKYETSGLRAEFYADYYTGSSSGEIGGSGWPVMTSSDNTNFSSVKGQNGSKGGIFKFSNGSSMRYISMNSLYGVRSIIGRGTTLSFWARGAYTNTSFNANHASNISMKFYAYYGTPLTSSNQTSVRETFEFTVNSGGTWQHFEMPLTEGRDYYGFGFFSQQSSGSTMYVPFDNIEIYTASPYASYTAPVSVTGVSVSPTNMTLEVGKTSTITATVSPDNATNKNVNWTSSNTSVATVSDGVVTAVAEGNATITATTVSGGYTASCTVKVVGKYPEGTFVNDVKVLSYTWKLIVALGNRENGLVSVQFSNTDAEATGVTYNDDTNQITITTTGAYSSYDYGNITGTYDEVNDRIINVGCSGGIGSYVNNNGSLTISHPTMSTYSAYYNCDGTNSELQSTFKRRFDQGNGWVVDTTNNDRITSNTAQFVSGSNSLRIRAYSGGPVALNLNSDWSPGKSLSAIQFWVYNPTNNDLPVRIWGYKNTNFGNNFETLAVTAKANGWTYVTAGFTTASIYNFQIANFNNISTALSYDNIYLYSIPKQ